MDKSKIMTADKIDKLREEHKVEYIDMYEEGVDDGIFLKADGSP